MNTVHAQHDMLKAELLFKEGHMNHNIACASYYLLQFQKAERSVQRVKSKLAIADQVVGRARMVIFDGGYVSALSVRSSTHGQNMQCVRSESFQLTALLYPNLLAFLYRMSFGYIPLTSKYY